MEIKFKINGSKWTIAILTSEEMKEHREDGEDLAGLAIPDDKVIYIEEDHVNYKTIVHELVHAYISDLHLDDTNDLKNEDFEEIVCSMFSDKGEKIIKQAKKLTKELQKLKEQE